MPSTARCSRSAKVQHRAAGDALPFRRADALVTEYGSRRNRKMVDFFARYARTCFEAFNGLVKYWLTFNEINIMLHSPFSGAGLVFEEGKTKTV